MRKHKIITELYNDSELNSGLNKICPDVRYRDDLKQELFLILTEMDEEKLIKMYDDNYIIGWIFRTLKNQYHSKSSPFYTKYKKNMIFIDTDFDIKEVDNLLEDFELVEEIDKILDTRIRWFESHLFRSYYLNTIDIDSGELLKPMSLRKIEEMHKLGSLKIDHVSVHLKVKDTLIKVVKILLEQNKIDRKKIDKELWNLL